MQRKTSLNIRVNPDLHYKFKYISEYEGRSMSGQILWLLNKCIREFERENGSIEVPENWK